MEGNREIGSDPNQPDRLLLFQGLPGRSVGNWLSKTKAGPALGDLEAFE